VQHYRMHLKAAALAGTYCINDPFWWTGDDKFFGFSLASRLGVATPKTVLLPQKDYIPAIDKNRSLRDLEFPLNWEAIVEYVGFPAVLKPADGGGWKNVSIVKNEAELLAAYDASKTNVMTLQEFIKFEEYVRCICIGQDRILPIHYDPNLIGPTGLQGAYVFHDKEQWLPKPLHNRVIEDAIKLNRALGYDMNSVEFAVRDGVPYAIDFTNPAPDMHIEHLGQAYFDTAVDWRVEFAVDCAKDRSRSLVGGYRWAAARRGLSLGRGRRASRRGARSREVALIDRSPGFSAVPSGEPRAHTRRASPRRTPTAPLRTASLHEGEPNAHG
jgi:hypothetical protein